MLERGEQRIGMREVAGGSEDVQLPRAGHRPETPVWQGLAGGAVESLVRQPEVCPPAGAGPGGQDGRVEMGDQRGDPFGKCRGGEHGVSEIRALPHCAATAQATQDTGNGRAAEGAVRRARRSAADDTGKAATRCYVESPPPVVTLPSGRTAMSAHPTTIADHRRTLVMHVMEDPPGRYTWRIVVEEKCGGADCDSMIEAATDYGSQAEAEAACWAAGNSMLEGQRAASELPGMYPKDMRH
ncbi:hypothetical protein D3C86_1495810 [compost metagenome]